MRRRQDSIATKFAVVFGLFTGIILILCGIVTYYTQMRTYLDQSKSIAQKISTYLSLLMENEKDDLIEYQEYFLEHCDEMLIPVDFDGYESFKEEFERIIAEEKPGKVFKKDFSINDLSDEAKLAYFTYMQAYWMTLFEEAGSSFGIPYIYYVVPSGEHYNMVFVIDAYRQPRQDNEKYLLLGDKVQQIPERHAMMWEAYNTGVSPDAYDAVKNEFGYTYGFHTPLVIDGKVIGVITAEQEVENVNKGILINTGKQLVILAVIFIMGMVLLLLFVNLNYITRLERLERGVTRYSDTKDPSIAREIEKYAKGDDEISNLSGKIAIMILELEDYMNNLIMTVDELNETKKKTSVMSDLALKDALTGIRNKAAYEQEAHKLSWSVAENTAVFGIAVINLNFLKSINENYGHEQGNLAIKNLCRLVCDIFQHSAVFRVGSDELAAILGKGDYENSDELIRKFESCIAENSNKTDQDPWEAFSAAIGYAKYDKYVDKSVEDVFNRAEKAMKNRKKEMKV